MKRGTVGQMVALRSEAETANVPVFYSRIEVSEQEYAAWSCRNGLQHLMAERKLLVPGAGARFLPELAPTESTILLSPRKGPSPAHSDMFVRLSQRGIDTIVVAGMVANLCVESHVREATDHGFQVVVVGDAVATLSDEIHEATLVNFGLLATEVVSTAEVLESLQSITSANDCAELA